MSVPQTEIDGESRIVTDVEDDHLAFGPDVESVGHGRDSHLFPRPVGHFLFADAHRETIVGQVDDDGERGRVLTLYV